MGTRFEAGRDSPPQTLNLKEESLTLMVPKLNMTYIEWNILVECHLSCPLLAAGMALTRHLSMVHKIYHCLQPAYESLMVTRSIVTSA